VEERAPSALAQAPSVWRGEKKNRRAASAEGRREGARGQFLFCCSRPELAGEWLSGRWVDSGQRAAGSRAEREAGGWWEWSGVKCDGKGPARDFRSGSGKRVGEDARKAMTTASGQRTHVTMGGSEGRGG
jgi:hypothetical protein